MKNARDIILAPVITEKKRAGEMAGTILAAKAWPHPSAQME